MVDYREDRYKGSVVIVHPGQDIALMRYGVDHVYPNDSLTGSCYLLLMETFDDGCGTILSGELIDYIGNLKKEKEEADEKCTKYRKLYFDLLDKTTASRIK